MYLQMEQLADENVGRGRRAATPLGPWAAPTGLFVFDSGPVLRLLPFATRPIHPRIRTIVLYYHHFFVGFLPIYDCFEARAVFQTFPSRISWILFPRPWLH